MCEIVGKIEKEKDGFRRVVFDGDDIKIDAKVKNPYEFLRNCLCIIENIHIEIEKDVLRHVILDGDGIKIDAEVKNPYAFLRNCLCIMENMHDEKNNDIYKGVEHESKN